MLTEIAKMVNKKTIQKCWQISFYNKKAYFLVVHARENLKQSEILREKNSMIVNFVEFQSIKL